MTCLGHLIGLLCSAGLLWLALLAATAALLSHGAGYIIGYGLLAAALVACALLILWQLAREKGVDL